MEIMKLNSQHKIEAAKVLADSFYHYPQLKHYFPDTIKRSKYLKWYMGKVLNCAMRYGEAFAASDMSGVIFILPPGHTKITTFEYAINGFLLVPFIFGLRQYAKVMECEDFAVKTHEEIMTGRAHYYLWGLAVDPVKQRSGVGSGLLKPLLDKADLENMPVYLETHDEKNVLYYQQKGFALIKTDMITGHDLRIWCMVREPEAMTAKPS